LLDLVPERISRQSSAVRVNAPANGGAAAHHHAAVALFPEIAALTTSGSSAVVAINALMLKRTKFAGIHKPGKSAIRGASAVPANPQPNARAAA